MYIGPSILKDEQYAWSPISNHDGGAPLAMIALIFLPKRGALRGFRHLEIEVTSPRVSAFRESILDLFQAELGDRFSTLAFEGFRKMLNYVGGGSVLGMSSIPSPNCFLFFVSSLSFANR